MIIWDLLVCRVWQDRVNSLEQHLLLAATSHEAAAAAAAAADPLKQLLLPGAGLLQVSSVCTAGSAAGASTSKGSKVSSERCGTAAGLVSSGAV
jgi:hypothetical protein